MQRFVILLLYFFLISNLFVGVAYSFPSEFSHGVTKHEPGATYSGFTLFTPIGGSTSEYQKNEVYLIDMQGAVVHKWQTESSPGTYGFLLQDGVLLYGGATKEVEPRISGGGGGVIQEIDWESNIIWEYKNKYLHHDFDKLPNGNILAIVWEPMRKDTQARVLGGLEGTELDGKIWTDAVIEIDHQTKEVVWSWHAQDELLVEKYPLGPLSQRKEWTHANTVEYLPQGNPFNGKESVMLSFRLTDTVVIFDKETKNIEWEWGVGQVKGQHDPTLLENGNILVFDNGMHRPDVMNDEPASIPRSRVIEINPQTDEIVWEYTGPGFRGHRFFSSIISGAQRLPNGNTLITEGINGRVFEIKNNEVEQSKDHIVWEYINPYYSPSEIENAVFRAYRYGLDDIDWPVNMPDPNQISKYWWAKTITLNLKSGNVVALPIILLAILTTSIGVNVYWLKKNSSR